MTRIGTTLRLRSLALWPLLLAMTASSPAASVAEESTEMVLPSGGAKNTATPAAGRSPWPAGSDAWLVLRTGIREGAEFRAVAAILERGRWIQADVGYYDSGDAGEFRLFWAGAGGAPIDRPGLRLELKTALSRSFGTTTEGELHLASNVSLSARPRPRWKLEISHTEALPLDRAALHQRALDRARLEYEAGRYQLGVGYAGAQSGSDSWEHRPFVSVSKQVAGFGEIELWLQRVERFDGSTERLQLRFNTRLSP